MSVDKFLQPNYTLYVMNRDFCYFISLFITHDQINISKLVSLLSKHYLLLIKLNELYVPFSIPNTLYILHKVHLQSQYFNILCMHWFSWISFLFSVSSSSFYFYKMLSSEWISIRFKAVKKHDINVLQLKVHLFFCLVFFFTRHEFNLCRNTIYQLTRK